LFEARGSGKGQIIDAAMSEGSGLITTMMYGIFAQGAWMPKGQNRFDSGAHFYDSYETKDGKYISIACAEPQFYDLLLNKLEVPTDDDLRNDRMNPENWPRMKTRFEAIFITKTRDEWDALLEYADVCYASVLDFTEAPQHPHNVEREAFIEIDGITLPCPTPRFSRSQCEIPTPPPLQGQNNHEVLVDFDFSDDDIAALEADEAL